MISVLAELERSLISERTRAGVKAAQRHGVKCGLKPKLTLQQIGRARKLIEDGQRREDVGRHSEREPHHPFTGRLGDSVS
jgi:DNA invertase Pin-like site-specific DNA recombinase